MSRPPPGVKGTTMRTGLAGHACAATDPAPARAIAATMAQDERNPFTASRAVNGRGLREERQQDVVHHLVVDLLETRVRNSRHHGELLVGIGQALEELDQVVEACNAVELAAHDQRWHGYFF